MRGAARDGFEVHVAGLARGGPLLEEFRSAGISAVAIGKRIKADPVALARLRGMFRVLRPDLVHTWNGVAGTYGRLAARAAGVKHIVAGEYSVERWKSAWQWFVDRRLAVSTDRYVVNNPAVRDECIERGLPAEKFSVIANGVEAARASDVSRAELLEELKCPPDARLIGVVSRLAPKSA